MCMCPTQIFQINNGAVSTRWEPASAIPDTLIEEYEKATLGDVITSYTSGGQTINTVSINSPKDSDSPQPKKARRENDDIENR